MVELAGPFFSRRGETEKLPYLPTQVLLDTSSPQMKKPTWKHLTWATLLGCQGIGTQTGREDWKLLREHCEHRAAFLNWAPWTLDCSLGKLGRTTGLGFHCAHCLSHWFRAVSLVS